MKIKTFWAFVREREAIRVRRFEEGRPAPWTSDAILRDHSFTNVRRREDPDTMRSLDLVARGSRTPFDFLWRTYAMRCLNRAETFEKYGLPTRREFARWAHRIDTAMARGEAIGARQHLTFWAHARIALTRITPAVAKLVHSSTNGISAVQVLASHRPTLYVGPYLGVLIVGDLALSKWGGGFGADTTVPVANGARVGLELVAGLDPRDAHKLFAERGAVSRRARSLREGVKPKHVDRVAELSRISERRAGFALTFMDVENCLCEFSRYARIAAGLTGHWRGRIERR